MVKPPLTFWIVLLALAVPLSLQLRARHISFEPGDVFVSLEDGPVQWWTPDGLLRSVMIPTVVGTGEGMAFDSSGNLYVTRWCIDGPCDTGNAVEMFNVLGQSMGQVGPDFDCNPHTLVILPDDTTYVGQAGCRKSIWKFVPTAIVPDEYVVAEDSQGVFWMDLAPDGCTMFYTSFGPNVKRFDVCANAQLPDFNTAPLPGGIVQDLRVLPDGGALVSSGEVVVRLDASGAPAQAYSVPGEGALWAGLDLIDANTFWAGNYFSSNLHKFRIDTGEKLATIATGVPAGTVVGVRVFKQSAPSTR
jgi:outer membrane protein assembly factor BamB